MSESSIMTGLKKGAKTVVLVAVLAGSLAAGAGSASAATPCWKLVLNDWFVDGRIDSTYPLKCYTQAQQHVNEDAKQYSSVQQDIQRALLAAVRKEKTQKSNSTTQTGTNGSSSVPPGGASGGSNNTPNGGNSGGGHHKGFITRAIDKIGPSNATSIPTPLLVLGGIALLLLALAAASWFARRYHARRLRPAPVSEPQRPDRP